MSIESIAEEKTLADNWRTIQKLENDMATCHETIKEKIAALKANDLYDQNATDEEKTYIDDLEKKIMAYKGA